MFLPSLFGPRSPTAASQTGESVPVEEKGESRKQAKMRARMEKGDKRVQQAQRR